MPRVALVGDNGRQLDLDLEGDEFYNQFADALILPANGESDDDELGAAWRGSWPRPHGPPPANLRLAVGVLVVQALSTITAADELADDPVNDEFGRDFDDYAREFVHDLTRGADLLSKWQARAFQLAVTNGMAELAKHHTRKRRRVTHDRANSAAAGSAAAAAASPAASHQSSSSGDSSDGSDGSDDSESNNADPPTPANTAAVLELTNHARALANVARDGSDLGAALDAQAELAALADVARDGSDIGAALDAEAALANLA